MESSNKRRRGIIPELPFEDTQALFALLVFAPLGVRALVLILFAVYKVQSAGLGHFLAIKGLLVALVVAAMLQDLMPVLYEPLQITALAAVAATVSGSPGLVTNALYAATLLSTWRVWLYAYRSVALMEDSPPVFALPTPRPPFSMRALKAPITILKETFFGSSMDTMEGQAQSSYGTEYLDWINHGKVLISQTLVVAVLSLALAQQLRLFANRDPTRLLVTTAPQYWTNTDLSVVSASPETAPGEEEPERIVAEPSRSSRRRLSALWKRQPLWTFLALLRLYRGKPAEQATANFDQLPTLCYVEDDCIGIKVPDVDRKLFVVDGVEWLQVFVDRKRNLAVIGGLANATSYQVDIFDATTGKSDRYAMSTMLPNSKEHARKLSASATLEEALAKARALLNCERQKLRKARKEHAKQLTALKAEVKAQESRYQRNMKADARSGSRISSLQDNERQLRISISSLESSIQEIELQIESRNPAHLERKRKFEAARSSHSARTAHSNKTLQMERATLERLCAELARTETKATRLHNRSERLASERDTAILAAETKLRSLLAGRAAAREARERRRVRLRHDFATSTAQLNEGAADASRKVQPWLGMPGVKS